MLPITERLSSLIQSLLVNFRIRARSHLPHQFTKKFGALHQCSLSPFLLNFGMLTITGITTSSSENNGILICRDKKLSNLEHASNIAHVNEDRSKSHLILQYLGSGVATLQTHFAFPYCKMLLEEWVASKPNIALAR